MAMPLANSIPVLLLAVAIATAGCSGTRIGWEQQAESTSAVGIGTTLTRDPDASASALLTPFGAGRVEGAIRFLQFGNNVVVRVRVTDLPANGTFGVHVHEGRSCIGESGLGGHFNPTNAPHGRPGSGAHHAGDLPNLRADAYGMAGYSTGSAVLTVGTGPNSVIGRVVVVSSRADDFRTQPDGNSGPPLACGFVRLDGRAFGAPPK
jgi:Cu-Zn family superoxide dismutase